MRIRRASRPRCVQIPREVFDVYDGFFTAVKVKAAYKGGFTIA